MDTNVFDENKFLKITTDVLLIEKTIIIEKLEKEIEEKDKLIEKLRKKNKKLKKKLKN